MPLSTSPQSPADVVAEVPDVPAAGVADAAARARTAGRAWHRGGAAARADALGALADRLAADAPALAALVVREVGKPAAEAAGEVARAVALLRYFAQQALLPVGSVLPQAGGGAGAGGLLFSERVPHGVAGLVTPWNFPLAIPLWKAAPALAAGNAVLLKPSPEATGVALALAAHAADVLPEGVFTVLPGGAETGSALVDAVDVVSFTGSSGVGRAVIARAAERGIGCQAEMGGSNATVVLADADPDAAVAGVLAGAFGYAGQKCTATSRVILVGDARGLAEAVVDGLTRVAPADPTAPGCTVGPVITSAAAAAVHDAVTEAMDRAERAGGGTTRVHRAPEGPSGPPGTSAGHYVAPVLVEDPVAGSRLTTTEVFGPIATMSTVADLAEAVRAVDGTRYGLVTSLYTSDLDAALAFSAEVGTGLVRVNQPTTGVDFHAPFGGEKESSYGPREQGPQAGDFYTRSRTVTIAPGRPART